MSKPDLSTESIRKQLDHPVIDSDGHLAEFFPVVEEYFKKVGGAGLLDDYTRQLDRTSLGKDSYRATPAERRDRWVKRSPFWTRPLRNHGLDLATSLFPDLMYKRLDEFGIDFAVLYPTFGIHAQILDDGETRRACCRAFNQFYADMWSGHQDRMTPVATIPMHTPEEAIAELEYAVRERGIKAVMLPSYVKRPIPAVVRKHPDMDRYAYWLDSYGLDSEYNYDPVWAKCQELGVIPSFHTPGEGLPYRNSISNYCSNHIGHFSSSAEAACRSLFLGGVSQRFPALRFLFLEGGVGWAVALMSDLASHWEKRCLEGLAQNTDPALLDQSLFMNLYREHGGKMVRNIPTETAIGRFVALPGDPHDDFEALNISSKRELKSLFAEKFYFGCEGDDPVTSFAFNDFGRLNAVYGSDISHWDVPDMSESLVEAHELVDKHLIGDGHFREFVFANPVRMWTSVNPKFFEGTAVAAAARPLVGKPSAAAEKVGA